MAAMIDNITQSSDSGRLMIRKSTVISILLVSSFIADGLVSQFYGKEGGSLYRFSLVLRVFIEGAAIFFLIARLESRVPRHYLAVTYMLGTAFVGGFGWLTVIGYDYSIAETAIYFNRYIIIFIFYAVLHTLFITDGLDAAPVFKTYRALVYVNSIAIISGFLFKIPLFESYGDFRFGYKGLIWAVNEASLFYVIAFFFALSEYDRTGKKGFLVIVSIASILLGTKAGMMLPLFGFLAYMLFYKRNVLKTVLFLIAVAAAAILTAVFLDLLPLLSNARMVQWFFYSYSTSDFMTMLFSGRNLEVGTRLAEMISRWGLLNWLFGGADIIHTGFEMDFLDLFRFFGILGSSLYIYALMRLLFIRNNRGFSILFIIFYLILATIAGHFFYSAVNAAYLAVLIVKLRIDGNALSAPTLTAIETA